MNIAASPLRADACGCLSCLDQQEAQQRIALFADAPQLLLASTGVLARNHPHVAADLLSTSEPLRRPEDQHICQCCECAYTRMRHQPQYLGTLPGFFLDG